MKHVLIDNLKGGEILAQEVWDNRGALWLAEGSIYKHSYLSKLHGLEINSVYIKQKDKKLDCVPKKEFDPFIFRTENKKIITKQFKRLGKSGGVNLCKFEDFVFDLMNDVFESSNIIENMYGMKHYNNYTYEHSVNVTVIAIMIAKEMGLSKDQVFETAMGCILHDLGKIQITADILDKPSTLTPEEFSKMKKHPIVGYDIVKNNENLCNNIKEIILNHHEKLDGSGYPFGIKGSDISIGTRICTTSDIFAAMCSERPYKTAVPFAESFRTMKASMNKQLDMEICQMLQKVLE